MASPISTSRSIGPTAALPSPPRENGVRPEPLRAMSRRRPVPVDHLAEQQRAAVAELRREAAELVAGVGLRDRRGARRAARCRREAPRRRCSQRSGVEAQLGGQLLVQQQQPGRRRRRRLPRLVQAAQVTNKGVVELEHWLGRDAHRPKAIGRSPPTDLGSEFADRFAAWTDEFCRRRLSVLTWLPPNLAPKNLADLYELAPLEWTDVRRTLENNLTQEPGTGGPGHHTFWLSTIDANGRPHMTAVGAFWMDGHYYFCGGPRTRKIRNIEHETGAALLVSPSTATTSRCEGRAVRVTDDALSGASPGCSPRVAGHRPSPKVSFTHEYSAPTPGRRHGMSTSSCPKTPTPSPPGARRRHPMDVLRECRVTPRLGVVAARVPGLKGPRGSRRHRR